MGEMRTDAYPAAVRARATVSTRACRVSLHIPERLVPWGLARSSNTSRPFMGNPMGLLPSYCNRVQCDNNSLIIGSGTYPLPASGWVVASPIPATHFGVVGGTSSWKTNAPTVVIDLAGISSPTVTGWMTLDTNANDDNGSLWAATTQVQSSWSYDITVTP